MLRKVSNGVASNLMYTAVSLGVVGSWEKFKIARTSGGEFSVYLNDTLVVAVSGTNPATDTTFTDAAYLVFDLDAGDKISYSNLVGDLSITKRI